MKKKFKWYRLILIIVLALILIPSFFTLCSYICQSKLLKYIDSYEKFNTDYLVAPTLEDGHYNFETDDEFKVMQLTDMHLGGGLFSFSKDKKAINAVFTMVEHEKPNLIICTGDNVFTVPYLSGSMNNGRAFKTWMHLFEKMGVYYTTTFGNHDYEVLNTTNKSKLKELLQTGSKCLFNVNDEIYGTTNQFITIRNSKKLYTKYILLLDSNDYVERTIKAALAWDYDWVHDDQVLWAKEEILKLNKKNEELIATLGEGYENYSNPKTLLFMHIPVSEYMIAFEELRANNFNDTTDSKYYRGVNNENDSEAINNSRIFYGGCSLDIDELDKIDKTFEVLSTVGLEGMFVGHDHVNNTLLKYKDVYLVYGYSIDYFAYSGISNYGLQRGNTIITINGIDSITDASINHNNYYDSKYVSQKGKETVILDKWYNESALPE